MGRAVPMLLAAAVAALPGCSSQQDVVRVVMRHSAFEPAVVRVAPGDTVRFVITNEDPIAHEFILGDDAVQDRHERGRHAAHGDLPGEVSVPAGETRETTYRFGAGGVLTFGCHLPGHYAYGMRGEVRIG